MKTGIDRQPGWDDPPAARERQTDKDGLRYRERERERQAGSK